MTTGDRSRRPPSVGEVMSHPGLVDLGLTSVVLRNAVRAALERERSTAVTSVVIDREVLTARIVAAIRQRFAVPEAGTINATGVLIHTNLGRVGVSTAAARAMASAAASMLPLEVDPVTGKRGDRQERVVGLLRAITGAEAALVVNNNAAAVLLAVVALAAGQDVVVSRGEAIEIGGGFRIPDILRHGGARLVEVGTTNRTYPADYAAAVTPATGMILKVHPGNFVISGYTRATSVAELVPIARAAGLPMVEDQGSGLLLDGLLDGERSVECCLREGADLVTASGDKLLGGPQCGLVLGRRELVDRLARHPLARALRVDKVTLAGLEATLRHYARGEERTAVPLWRMATASPESLHERAVALAAAMGGTDFSATVVISEATFGGGAAPGVTLPSVAVQIRVPGTTVDTLARRLRTGTTGIWARIAEDGLMIDLRSVLPEQDAQLREILSAALVG